MNKNCEVYGMNKEPLKIKKKSDDGHRIISIRIREDILSQVDHIADLSNRSRNEIINMILEHGIQNTEVE